MAHIQVHRVEQIAKRRLARTAQIEAMPPQPERYRGSHWNFTRPGFVHSVYPGLASQRIGKDDPRVADIKDKALAANIDIDIINDLTLDDFIVFPDSLSATIGGISFRSEFRSAGVASAQELATQFLPTGQTRIVSLEVNEATFQANTFTRRLGEAFPAPVIVRHISCQGSFSSALDTHQINFLLPAVGFRTVINGQHTWGMNVAEVPMNEYVLYGAVQPEVLIEVPGFPVGPFLGRAYMSVVVELLKRKT